MIQNMEKNWRDLIKPAALEVEKDTSTATYGKFVARPLERGFGLTLGNSLRRVLLSSLQGTAVVAVRIQGVQHEFTSIPDVVEDVTEFILNVKELRFKIQNSSGEATVSIHKEEEGAVTAADIDASGGVEILDPAQHICTLGKGGKLQAEFMLKAGRGFVSAKAHKSEDLPIGWIAVDSLFSPVQKVNYSVTNARVGQRTDYDKLELEVWTDSSVSPPDAVAFSSKIIRDQMTVFLNFEEEEEPVREPEKQKKEAWSANLYRSVEELELSVRSANCLQNADIRYIYELVQKSEPEMLRTKNFGRKSLNEIKEVLAKVGGLSFGMKLEGFEPPEKPSVPTPTTMEPSTNSPPTVDESFSGTTADDHKDGTVEEGSGESEKPEAIFGGTSGGGLGEEE